MKLEGSLDAFSLPDVFQLLSLTKKSGGLHLANGQATGVVYFNAGVVTGACSNAARQSLARRLVGIGACDDAALRRAVERATTEGVGVARALLESGAVNGELIQQLALEQAIDSVFDLLRWVEGDFAFGVGEDNPDDVGLAVSSEHVVSEATARRENWDAVSKVIPSPDVLLTMPVVVTGDQSLTRDEWSLLALVDGQRSVGDIVEISGASQFAVVATLTALVQRGMLVIRDEEAPDHIELVQRRQQLLGPLEITPTTSTETLAPASAPPEPQVSAPPVPGLAAESHMLPEIPSTPAVPAQPAPVEQPAVAPAAAQAAPGLLGGAHDPLNVVPPRPEPFMPKRAIDHPEPARSSFASPAAPAPPAPPAAPVAPQASSVVSATASGGAAAAVQPVGEAAIERDPTVNRSLMLRLIAGVRGL